MPTSFGLALRNKCVNHIISSKTKDEGCGLLSMSVCLE